MYKKPSFVHFCLTPYRPYSECYKVESVSKEESSTSSSDGMDGWNVPANVHLMMSMLCMWNCSGMVVSFRNVAPHVKQCPQTIPSKFCIEQAVHSYF